MPINDKKIISIKPTEPGFLLVSYSDGSSDLREIQDAPNSDEINDLSPTLHGSSDKECPHCQAELEDYFQFMYFSKVIKEKVYSYNQLEWEEVVVGRYCSECFVDIFDWEMEELYIDYVESATSAGGLDKITRLEPITGTPGNCPGVRKVACNGFSGTMTCEGYPKCLKTLECKEDWRINIDGSKISLHSLNKPRNISKLLKSCKDRYDV